MRLSTLPIILSVCLLCSCGDEEDNAAEKLSAAQIGSVAQSITSLTEAAVQNEVSSEGETVSPVMARNFSKPFSGLSVLGAMGMPMAQGQAPQAFVFNGNDIDFTGAVSFNTDVNLDGTDYPNATGSFNIAATASAVTGTLASGSITFDPITVTCSDSVTVTDPNSGATATWPDGTTFNYSVSISWTRSDKNNWSYTTTTTSTATDRTVTVSGKGGTFSGDVDHDFTWARTISRAGGGAIVVSLDTFSGTRDVVWTNLSNGNNHEVNWVITSLTDIQVTVDGFTFNFNSLLALVALLNANLNHDG